MNKEAPTFMNKEAPTFIFFLFGVVGGFVAGALAFSFAVHSPNYVCRADCEVRGFHQGQFVIEPERCTCWNREFEKPSPAQEGESL